MSHPAEVILLRYSVDDLPSADGDAVRRHVETCAECRQALAILDADREALLSRTAPALLVASLERRRFAERQRHARWISGGVVTALAAAAALVLFVRVPRPSFGIKGGGLAVYAKRSETVRLLGPNDQVRPGDALRMVVTLDRRCLVRAWSVDDEGRVDALMPEPRQLGPGTVELEGSAVVEQPCVSGWLVVAVGEAARRTPDGKTRTQTLSTLSDGGFTQRLTCESR
jgi:hypothetical protein